MNTPTTTPIPKRSIGLLTHITSLPNNYGIGTLGQESYQFIDFLNNAGFSYWQMCPVGPTGYGDSPYQSFSAFAGNSYFLDLEEFLKQGLLTQEDLEPLTHLSKSSVDYAAIYNLHKPILQKAYQTFQKNPPKEFTKEISDFSTQNQSWLQPYCTFTALKDHFNQSPWWEWPLEFQSFETASKTSLYKDKELIAKIEFYRFIQCTFFHQWNKLKDYAHSKNIELLGDIPIFVALDSADLWSNNALFKLDKQKHPTHLAGVPPDYFSELGQFWGNPLYDWQNKKKECFNWWIQRIENNFKLFDLLRLDHFRGFETYWSIPADSPDARTGEWLKGPGLEFFQKIKEKIPNAKLIAEDLGIITDQVRTLLKSTGLPGMAVLQFAFDNHPENPFLPHNLKKNQILYSGTHDNDTTRGWYNTLKDPEKDQIRRYFRIPGNDIAWDFIRTLYASTCNLAIITMQDLLNKNSEARLNLPGTAQGNWKWRFTSTELEMLEKNSTPYLKELKWLYYR